MVNIFTVEEYKNLIPEFMNTMKPYIEGELPYRLSMTAIIDCAPWFELIEHYDVIHSFNQDKEYRQRYADFFAPEFPSL